MDKLHVQSRPAYSNTTINVNLQESILFLAYVSSKLFVSSGVYLIRINVSIRITKRITSFVAEHYWSTVKVGKPCKDKGANIRSQMHATKMKKFSTNHKPSIRPFTPN